VSEGFEPELRDLVGVERYDAEVDAPAQKGSAGGEISTSDPG